MESVLFALFLSRLAPIDPELDDEREIARRLQEWVSAHPAPRGTLAQVADHATTSARSRESITSASAPMTTMPEGPRRPRGSIAGLKLLRVLRKAERVATEMRKERKPSLAGGRTIRAR